MCEDIKNNILTMSSVTNFYIGKTDDIEGARKRHSGQYDRTDAIAVSNPENINKAEKYAIDYLGYDSRLQNVRDGGAGNPNTDTLYICLKSDIKTIDEIDDCEAVIKCYELLPIV